MDNIILMKKSSEMVNLSQSLGFKKSLFLNENFVHLTSKSKKELLRKVKEARKKNLMVIYKASDEAMLRFALEKTKVDLVYGMESINPKDSVHFPRGGLDQITCKIAATQGKMVGFSFQEILNSADRAKLLRRMMFNLKLCKKYKIKVLFSNFSLRKEEMRSLEDLKAFLRVLSKNY